MRDQQRPIVEPSLFRNLALDDMSASLRTNQTAPSILCVGQDAGLLDTRAALLRRIGAEVQCANGVAKALRAIESADFDLLILCYNMQESEKRIISSAAHQQPHSPLILLLSSLSALDSGREGVIFDEIADSHPASLTACARDLLERRCGTIPLMTGHAAG
jgi:CheY-like chemotaxis protein